ncbi:MAG: hypothetical protein PHR53_08650, partial [Bacteroidales bacterium]|nr:hypothetical protein [Bacteroidales bacterium]
MNNIFQSNTMLKKFFCTLLLCSFLGCLTAQNGSEKWLENLVLPSSCKDSVILEHSGFIICYSAHHQQAYWVGSRLT